MAAAGADDFIVEQSDWRDAPVLLGGETVLAVGDVHGCHGQLAALLDRLPALAEGARLIFLGDLICRGPSSLKALALWAAPALDARFAQVNRLSGNHEQLLMLSIGDAVPQAACARWMSIDGLTSSTSYGAPRAKAMRR
jgi:serine/threonine protein phosphatase 1